ncbi:DUF4363 family protein [Ruminiclostridium josui]|uniref:DUF4363 family protein n=1 Tax=Ruminiclostridium josui TaxID=1499 RepID=UPI000465940C|nr:DUF4363 family protein [Ruminiclostridium josui]
MRKFLVITIPIITLILFIFVMESDIFLKRSLGKNDSISESINAVINDIQMDDWDKAVQDTNHLSEVWKKIVRMVQFSSERDEINAFSINLARLRGSILAKDKAGAFTELYEAYEHWEDLGK